MILLRPLVLLLLISSCNTPRAVFDYDEHTNFDQFTTYNFYPDLLTGLNPLDEKRVVASLEKALGAKGFSVSSKPHLYVNVYAEEYQEDNRSRFGVGVGGGSGNVGVGVSGGVPIGGPDTFLRLTLDLINAAEDELVWQAVVTGKINKNASPEQRQANLDKMVKKALESYPPKNR